MLLLSFSSSLPSSSFSFVYWGRLLYNPWLEHMTDWDSLTALQVLRGGGTQ